jgi:hypothetical protein
MQWQHYNSIKSAMWYIESLLHEIEVSLENKETAYQVMEIDLTKEQISQIKKQLNVLYSNLKKVKKDFGLSVEPIKLSRIIDTNTGFIWQTIEDSWSSEIEKTSGKISSIDKKKQLDESLRKIWELTNNIREIAKHGRL